MSAGIKNDQGKPMVGLLSTEALVRIAEVMTFGTKKYGAHNWRGGIEWQRVLDAALRHLLAFNGGEDLDPETRLSHLAHAGCCIMFLLEYQKTHPELDNRYKPSAPIVVGQHVEGGLFGRTPTVISCTVSSCALCASLKND